MKYWIADKATKVKYSKDPKLIIRKHKMGLKSSSFAAICSSISSRATGFEEEQFISIVREVLTSSGIATVEKYDDELIHGVANAYWAFSQVQMVRALNESIHPLLKSYQNCLTKISYSIKRKAKRNKKRGYYFELDVAEQFLVEQIKECDGAILWPENIKLTTVRIISCVLLERLIVINIALDFDEVKRHTVHIRMAVLINKIEEQIKSRMLPKLIASRMKRCNSSSVKKCLERGLQKKRLKEVVSLTLITTPAFWKNAQRILQERIKRTRCKPGIKRKKR